MHFSVGQFTQPYLSKAPIGVMRDEHGKMIAFCSLMPTHFNDAISVDLILMVTRARSTFNGWTVFTHVVMGSGKEYKAFNMGMATLSNVGTFTLLLFKRTFSRASL